MSTGTIDGAACGRARAAMVAARRVEHRLLETVTELEAGAVATAAGYRSTRRLLEDLWHLDPARAKRLLTQAELLCPRRSLTGEVLPAVLPATAAAHAQGLVEDGHLRVIAAAMDHLSRVPGLAPEVFAEAEAVLGEQATVLAPRGLEKVARRLIARLDPDGAAPPEEPEPVDEVHLLRRRDGRLVGTIDIRGRAEAELVTEVFDRLSAPAGPDDPRTLAQRRAETLTDLCAQAASPTGIAAPDQHPPSGAGPLPAADDARDDDTGHDADEAGDDGSDDLAWADEHAWADGDAADEGDRAGEGGEGGEVDQLDAVANSPAGGSTRPAAGCPVMPVLGRALLAVTIDDQWLRAQVGHGLLDSEHTIDPATARRLACDAGIVPMVLGSRSEPLDVGRLSYTVPEGMRRALQVRDGGCTWPACTRRPARCHAHHIRHWIEGGPTALHNLTLSCRYHHHLIHHDHWQIRMNAGRPEYIPPPWIDPRQRPRPGGRAPLLA